MPGIGALFVAVLGGFAVCGVAVLGAHPAFATCVTSGATISCIHRDGSSTTTTRVGNHTFETGVNADGSSWSQSTQRSGRNTVYSGQSDGKEWNLTEKSLGHSFFADGTDTKGNSWSFVDMGPAGFVYSGTDSNGRPITRACNYRGC